MASFLVQVLLPLRDNEGQAYEPALFRNITAELTERFGGVTAYTRSPAEGLWQSDGKTHQDDIVVVEVMTDKLNERWWRKLRQRCKREFRQREVVVRAQKMRRL